jgi:Regulated-SNARE-like domain
MHLSLHTNRFLISTWVACLQHLFKKLSSQRGQAPERLSAEAGLHTFHVLNSGGVSFLTLAEKSYPKKLAYQYLEELSSEFTRLYGGQQVESVSRPYAFIKFGVPTWQRGRTHVILELPAESV